MPDYVLGLDVGSNSVGWAMIAQDAQTFDNGKPILAGIRVFPMGLKNEKDKAGRATGQGVPPGRVRRQKRSERRQHDRRNRRRKRLRQILESASLFPRTVPERDALLAMSPYPLRENGPHKELTLHEFGRVLYHLCQRRGYQSNRKFTDKDDPDAKDTKRTEKEITSLRKELKQTGMTLGEYLAKFTPKDGDKCAHKDEKLEKQWVRNQGALGSLYHRSTSRRMYKDEFEKLWSRQETFHPDVLTDELKNEIFEAIFFQRRVWWPADSIGQCELTGQPRCPKAHWYGQQFRMLQEINNLQVVDGETGEERFLAPDERARLTEGLTPSKKLTFAAIRKLLWPKKKMHFRTFEESAQRKDLKGNAVEAGFRKGTLGPWYDGLTPGQKKELYDTIVETEIKEVAGKKRCYGIEPGVLRAKAVNDWDLSTEQADELVETVDRLPGDYFNFSLSAIRKIIPHLEKGMTIDKAIQAAGFERQPTKACDLLAPVCDVARSLTNPLVHRALSEARKIINAIIREHGKPKEIVVELAREMKRSRKHRERMLTEQKQRERENDQARKELQAAGLNPDSRRNMLKYKLWKEYRDLCGDRAQCPYCGAVISHSALYAEGELFEIDHILPRSRSMDNSFNNLALCCTKCNREKGNRTPFEAWGQDNDPRFDEILHRIEGFNRPRGNRGKYRKFDMRLTEDAGVDNLFEKSAETLLKATQHTAKQAVAYLQSLYDNGESTSQGKVRCVSGGMTYDLRRCWGLNDLFGIEGPPDKKNRTDHRHHAVDAVVIALTTYSHVHKLSNKYRDPTTDFPPPWEGFRRDVQEAVDVIGEAKDIAVSHRPQRTLAGPLHEETRYGPVRDEHGRHRKGIYVYRKRVEDLTPPMINGDAICDEGIRRIIQEECRKRDGIGFPVKEKPGKKLSDPPPTIPSKGWKTRPTGSSGIPIKRVRVRIPSKTAFAVGRDPEGEPDKYVITGGNHHVEVYQATDEKGRAVWTGKVVTRFETYQRLKSGSPVIRRDPRDGSRFLFSLCINDMVLLTDPKTGERQLYRLQTSSQNPETKSPDMRFRLHTAALIDDDNTVQRIRSWKAFMATDPNKVTVDPLGRIHPCND